MGEHVRVVFETRYTVAGRTYLERLEGMVVDTVVATGEAVVRLDDGLELTVNREEMWEI